MSGVKTIDSRSTGLRITNGAHVLDSEDIMTEQPNHSGILSENDELHKQDNEVEREQYLNNISTNGDVDSEWELSEVSSSSQWETLQTNSIYSNIVEISHQKQEMASHTEFPMTFNSYRIISIEFLSKKRDELVPHQTVMCAIKQNLSSKKVSSATSIPNQNHNHESFKSFFNWINAIEEEMHWERSSFARNKTKVLNCSKGLITRRVEKWKILSHKRTFSSNAQLVSCNNLSHSANDHTEIIPLSSEENVFPHRNSTTLDKKHFDDFKNESEIPYCPACAAVGHSNRFRAC